MFVHLSSLEVSINLETNLLISRHKDIFLRGFFQGDIYFLQGEGIKKPIFSVHGYLFSTNMATIGFALLRVNNSHSKSKGSFIIRTTVPSSFDWCSPKIFFQCLMSLGYKAKRTYCCLAE